MAKIMSKLRNKRGFTLIELIVVLAVLAIIMAIAVPRFGGVREQAKVDADMATLASIAKLAEFEFVRLNTSTDEEALSDETIKSLIKNNFGDGKIFQSEDLKDYTGVGVEFIDGKVTTIIVTSNGKDHTFEYADGKDDPKET